MLASDGGDIVRSAVSGELNQGDGSLNERHEEFGRIAVLLKALEDENLSLKKALEENRSQPSAGEEQTAYVEELEKENLLLQETVERLTAEMEVQQEAASIRQQDQVQLQELRAQLAGMQAKQEAVRTLQGELEAVKTELTVLMTENETLRVADQKRRETEGRNRELQRTIECLMEEATEYRKEAEFRKERLAQLEVLRAKLTEMQVEHGRIQALNEELESVRAVAAEQAAFLKTENDELRQAGQQQYARSQEREKELEERNLALQETVARLKSETVERLQDVRGHEEKLEALGQRFRALRGEHEQLQSSRTEADARQQQVVAKFEAVEAERQELLGKLEQSVLIMRSLEDENVHLKRSLEASEEKQATLVVVSEKVANLEAENDRLQRIYASMAGERERHAQAQERIRTLEAEGVALHQKLAAQENENRLQVKRKEELDRLLRDLLGELAEMRKTLTL
ncbi:hypothetical protein NQF87_02895 [Bombella sp. TMW 2.2559]|uniref:Uncharacterized protein n=1 Tax=Bombella dulcis TaxID=2967339 RepID=A0ABT3WA00_9PROT|nr:hypothetical protein [Bombella dulcis]MCX5615927.1 hypothetical protein [Bombella dulcis]